jgi:hypothetical protein
MPGNSAAACGSTGVACVACSTTGLGPYCFPVGNGGNCGCQQSTDCAVGLACGPGSKQVPVCSTTCGFGAVCNGGCCNGTTCAPGTGATACADPQGLPMCVDCNTSPNGRKCTATGCGCTVAADCQPQESCNTTTHRCEYACGDASHTACNGGCCDPSSLTCALGTDVNACGSSGGSCAPCSTNANGHSCVSGQCGCNFSYDCPSGTACNGGVCTTACSPGNYCAGNGCCDGTRCQPGTAAGACGQGGGACNACSGATPVCLITGQCGCVSGADCPLGQSCYNGTCSTQCGGSGACNGGCCDTSTVPATCVAGTKAAACGSKGDFCRSCANDGAGLACIPSTGGGFCGCTTAVQCPVPGSTCTGNQCVTTVACMTGGCPNSCCGSDGSCHYGGAATACGTSSNLCVDCSNSNSGHACRNGYCGCYSASDCPVGYSCSSGSCSQNCFGGQPCNGGCCADTGVCVIPSMQTGAACGTSGACLDCNGSSTGVACVAGQCGCNTNADCFTYQSCNTTTHQCSASCSPTQPCNLGCCSLGTCVAGTSNAACGVSGACTACSGSTPTCQEINAGADAGITIAIGGQCVNLCGPMFSPPPPNVLQLGECSNGFCCQGGTCITGGSAMACGLSGQCLNCAAGVASDAGPSGTTGGAACVNGGSMCGCNTTSDCPAANGNNPGESCDLTKHQCTSACSPTQQCNGGCCGAGRCSSGTVSFACGTSGVCANCESTCGTGTACISGACGCNSASDCTAQSCGARATCMGGACCIGFGQPCNGTGCCSGNCVSGFCQ